MKEIKTRIEELKVSLEGIPQGEYKTLFENVSSILEGLLEKVEGVMVNQAVIAETVNYINDDLSDIQEELFEEVSLEELDDIEEEYTETTCNSCGKPIFIEASALEEKNGIECPYCGENIISTDS